MDGVQNSIKKNMAAQRNSTNIAIAVPNATRWSGNYAMVSNYQKAYQPLKQATFSAESAVKAACLNIASYIYNAS